MTVSACIGNSTPELGSTILVGLGPSAIGAVVLVGVRVRVGVTTLQLVELQEIPASKHAVKIHLPSVQV
jgi:hypothetical protein